MKSIQENTLLILSLIAVAVFFSSHDMFLKMDGYHLKPNTPSTIQLYNGTFDKSDNVITSDRMIDVSLVGNGNRIAVDTSQWSDKGTTTILDFTTGDEGTWVAGVSTKARSIELEAESFNDYLEHDGVLDELDFRKQNKLLEVDALEKYSKHVKTIFQVGNSMTDDWKTILDYPIEFVPLSNPYSTTSGDELQIKLLWHGKPLSNQLVYAGTAGSHTHSHDEDEEHHHHDAKMRTDEDGIVSLKLNSSGEWYVRTIHMQRLSGDSLTHESNWATLTFEISGDEKLEKGYHTHADGSIHKDHKHSKHKYTYWILGFLLLGALIFWNRSRNK